MAKATVRNIDFSNVKEGGNFNKKRVPAGDYLATITKVEDAKAKKDGTPQYLFSIKLQKYPSAVYPYYINLQDNQYWKLRNLLIAAGKAVPKSRQKVDPNQLVGKLIGVSLEDTEYDGKDQSQVQGVFPAADLADDPSAHTEVDDDSDETTEDSDDDDAPLDESYDTGEEDEAEDAAEEEPEEEEAAADPYADLDRAALKRELKKLDPDFKAKTSQSDDDLRAMLAAAAGSDEDEAEEEEPEPAPVVKKAAAKKKPSAKDVSDDELDEIDIDDI